MGFRASEAVDLPVSRKGLVIYRVTARFRSDTAADLRRKLDDGSIAAQQPTARRSWTHCIAR